MLIGLSGLMGSGKDAAAEILVRDYGFVRKAFADRLKEEIKMALEAEIVPEGIHEAGQDAFLTCLALGILDPFSKPTSPEMRTLLQQWGTEFRRRQDADYWVNKVFKSWIADGRPDTVITDVRFTNEIKRLVDEGGIPILVDGRRQCVTTELHESERLAARRSLFHYFINNTVEDPSLRFLSREVHNVLLNVISEQVA